MAGNAPVTQAECSANVNLVLEKIDIFHRDIASHEIVLRGAQGRNGLVKDVNFLMNQSRTMSMIVSAVVGVISAVIGTLVTHAIIG